MTSDTCKFQCHQRDYVNKYNRLKVIPSTGRPILTNDNTASKFHTCFGFYSVEGNSNETAFGLLTDGTNNIFEVQSKVKNKP